MSVLVEPYMLALMEPYILALMEVHKTVVASVVDMPVWVVHSLASLEPCMLVLDYA